MHVCMYVCMYVCVYVCMHVCMYACMHACMYVCMYACMHACIYCMYVWVYPSMCMSEAQHAATAGAWLGANSAYHYHLRFLRSVSCGTSLSPLLVSAGRILTSSLSHSTVSFAPRTSKERKGQKACSLLLCYPGECAVLRAPDRARAWSVNTRSLRFNICMHACMYVCMHCMYVCMNVCMHVCMHACKYAYMYVCMSVCLYTCM